MNGARCTGNVTGIILAVGTGTRLLPLMRRISKQMLPVYDKPMSYHPLSTLTLAGITNIRVITTPAGESAALILGDNLIHGSHLPSLLGAAAERAYGATVFAYRVNGPQHYHIVEFDSGGRAVTIEKKPDYPRSDWAVTGFISNDRQICSIAARVRPSARGEVESAYRQRIAEEPPDV